jgi:hypothetical protein
MTTLESRSSSSSRKRSTSISLNWLNSLYLTLYSGSKESANRSMSHESGKDNSGSKERANDDAGKSQLKFIKEAKYVDIIQLAEFSVSNFIGMSSRGRSLGSARRVC